MDSSPYSLCCIAYNDTLKTTGRYTLKLHDEHKGVDTGDTLQIVNDSILRIVEFEGEDMLVLRDYCMDCFVSRFIRRHAY